MAQHSVNVTILVLAHKNLLQLSRLIRHLQSDFDVFVHLDDRSNMQVSDFSEFNRTRVIKKFRTTWGSLGIVRATLELFTLASSGGRYDRFVLISGQDVPLKTNKELIEFFELHRNVDFVQTEALTGKNESRLRRVDSFHFFPKSVRSWVWHQNGPFSYFLTQTITNLGKYLDGLIARIGFRRPLDYSFRWGAQWMDLRSETLEGVLDFVHTNSHFLK